MFCLCRLVGCLGMLALVFVRLGLAADEQPAAAEDAPHSQQLATSAPSDDVQYMRILRSDDDLPKSLQTAIVTLCSAGQKNQRVTVDLIGAVHIGDPAYYESLNKQFRKYDAVLYELVAPENDNVPKPGRAPGGLIGGAQLGMKAMLGLSFQLDHIDYSAKNMVHADMSPAEFDKTMTQRDESWFGLFFRSMGHAYAEQANDPLASGDWRLIAAMFAEDRAYQLKLVLAEEFADMESQIEMLYGEDGSTIITERNKKALSVLKREIEAGKRRLAIFYGAGHMPDFTARLQEDFGLKPAKTKWMTAWSLEKPKQDKQQDDGE